MPQPVAPAPTLSLDDGAMIPQLGLGLYKVPAGDAEALCRTAIDLGYRHLDTAAFYANEAEVGRAVRTAPVPREELFVTSKVWKDDNGFDTTLRAFDASMARFGFETLDLFLIHWPVPSTDLYVDTWRALARLQEEGRVRSIGVANFHPHHIERLIAETGVAPVVNQVELHPWLPQAAVREFDAARGIRTEAWSPLARGRVLGTPLLDDLADKHGRDPGLGDEALDVVGMEVRHADGSDAALLLQPDQRSPRVDIAVGRRHRPVDEVKVERVEAEPVHARVEGAQRGVEAVVVLPDLGGDEELLPRHGRPAHGAPHLRLVRVERGRVEVPVPEVDRGTAERLRIAGRHLVQSQAELRDHGAVVERQRRGGGDGLGPVSYTHLTLPTN